MGLYTDNTHGWQAGIVLYCYLPYFLGPGLSLNLEFTEPRDPPVSASQCWNYRHTSSHFLLLLLSFQVGAGKSELSFFMPVRQILSPLSHLPSPILSPFASVTDADERSICNWTIRNLTSADIPNVLGVDMMLMFPIVKPFRS